MTLAIHRLPRASQQDCAAAASSREQLGLQEAGAGGGPQGAKTLAGGRRRLPRGNAASFGRLLRVDG